MDASITRIYDFRKFGENLSHCIKSYVTDWRQGMRGGNDVLGWRCVSHEVTQGFVLGPLFSFHRRRHFSLQTLILILSSSCCEWHAQYCIALTLRLFLNEDIYNDLTHLRLRELLLNTSSLNLNTAYKLKLDHHKLKHYH